MHNEDLISYPGVLALECAPGATPARDMLERDEAETLAGHIAADLAHLLPGMDATRLAVVGALFDAAQLLRPQFPAWTTLDELAARLPRERGDIEPGGIVAFGARDGHMPAQSLSPDPALRGSPMLYLPWTVQAPATHDQALGQAMETELIGRGEAGARSADFLMRTLDLQLEHARYLTRHDLLALTCVQYEHASLAPLWSVLETALLSPDQSETTLSARGLPLRYENAAAHIASPLTQLRATRHESPQAAAHTLAGWVFELRQYAAVLHAHQLPLHIDDNAEDHATRVLEHLADPDPSRPPPTLHTHTAPGLGIIAISVTQPDGRHMRNLAHALILGGHLADHCSHLAERYGADPEPHALERICLDDANGLCVPSPHKLH